MRTRLLAVVLSWLCPVVCGAEPPLEGRWIGGFQIGPQVIGIDATLTSTPSGLTGVMNVPQQDAWNLPLQHIAQRGNRVRFELPVGREIAVFTGRLEDDGWVRGTVRQGPAHVSRFELLHTTSLAPPDLQGIAGTYATADGTVFLVAQSGEGVVYVDYASGRTGSLFAVSRDRFVAGQTAGIGYPVALDLMFDRGADGIATEVTVTGTGQTRRAHRATFYQDEDVTITNGDVTIAGTLLLPARPGPHPAIVMSHGSGSVTRDALRRSADHFARHGIAVLITDKRGCGQSTGSWQRATFDDLASDALAGVHVLRARHDIQQAAIGLHGASLGGWVVPLAASRSPHVAFVIVESAPTVTPLQHERLRVESQMGADGFGRTEIAQALSFMDLKFEVARTGAGWPRIETAIREGAATAWLAYTNPPASLAALQWDWTHILEFDPLPVLRRLDVPVLALYGGRDTIVPARVHQARMAGALDQGRRTDVTVDVFETANHGFLEAMTGGRREASQLTSFVDGYFEQRTAWVLDAVRSAAARATMAGRDVEVPASATRGLPDP